MWPMYVDYSDEECKKVLRSLELEAYSSVITAFRAQGSLTKDRKKMLLDLCSTLSISMERHRAEIRRAVNDEHLNTIAERLFGPNTATEWAIEGRRVVPLVNRLAPQTVFTEMASNAATAQAIKNASLPAPGKTGSREMSNGMETMTSRKRKECPPDASVSPQKISVMDSQYFHNFHSFEGPSSGIPESMQVPEVSLSSENFPIPENTPQTSSPFPELNTQKNVPPLMTHPVPTVSAVKSPSKHSALKTSSTVTTFSTSDQMASNLLASRGVPSTTGLSAGHEEQMPVTSEVTKSPSDGKSAQRPLSSIGSMKSSTIVIPTTVPSTCSASSSKDRLSTSSSTTSHSKFLSQIRSKTPGHTRQNLPAGLGIKLTPQSSISQRATISPKSPGMKMKSDNTNIFSKKTSASVFPSPSPDNQPSQLPAPASSESLTISKSPVSVSKPTAKSDSQTLVNQQTTSKQTASTKNMPKTTTASTTTSTCTTTTTSHASQYISRPLFPTSGKSSAKNLSPVIFNVSSTSCTPLQNTVKQTGQIQGEVVKSPQLLPKTPLGLSSSHLKINTSTTQTVQYRSDGGLVRSARIVNLSQPVGSRLPCAISSSTISALGLSSNISSTALRVTLPAGTLNTTNSIRVSSAAKPNVIVVHKAQMWPRPPQGAAVIMSSTPLTKISNDIVQETISITPKQEKSKSTGIKTIPRAIAPARPQSPAVAITSLKASETTPVSNSNTVTPSLPDSSSSEVQNSKTAENVGDGKCKKNLLAEIIQASGILESNSADKNSKEKSDAVKNNKDISNLSNHQELELNVSQKSTGTTASDINPTRLSESNMSKEDTASNNKAAGDSAVSVSQSDVNGKETPKQVQLPTEIQSKEAGSVTISSTHSINDTVASSSECGSKSQKEVLKDKDL